MEEGNMRLDPGGPEDTHTHPEDRGNPGDQSQRRMTHNMVEKRRKDKIKQWISHIAQLLPPINSTGPDNRPSTLDIMERAAKYISELKASYEEVVTEKGDPVLVAEMNKMRNEIEKLNRERDHLAGVIKAQGISLQVDASHLKGNRRSSDGAAGTSSADNESHLSGDNSSDSGKRKSSRRQNTISAHLEQQKLQEQQQQQALSQLMSQNGAVVMPGQNMLLNPSLASAQQTSVSASPNITSSSGAFSSSQDMVSPEKLTMNNACTIGLGGLIQIAMQNAGITQMDSSQQPSPVPAGDMQADTISADSRLHPSQLDESHDALQTLASVASNTVSSPSVMFTSMPTCGVMNMMHVGGNGTASLAANTVTVTSAMNQNTPIMSVGQPNSQHQTSSQANMLMGMNFVNSLNHNAGLSMMNPGQNQVLLSGAGQGGPASMIPSASGLAAGTILLNQHGNVLIINENGMPVPYDPTTGTAAQTDKMSAMVRGGTLSASSNSAILAGATMSVLDQQQALINSGALTLGKTDHSVSSALASLTVSQPQASILAGMNPQMAGGMNFLGPQLLTQNTLQSLAVQQGGQGSSFLNQQLLQSMGMPFSGMIASSAAGGMTNTSNNQASQAIPGSAASGLGPAGGNFLFPTNQAGGMVALNTIPSNPQHLPSAFVLPSGHVIPVVSNPQLVPSAQHGNIMTAAGASGAAAGTLQLPQMTAGPGAAGQVIQMDSSNNPNNPQIIIGPGGLQMAAPHASQSALTTQQQLQQLLQQQHHQQNISLMMPTPTINVSQTTPTSTAMTVTSVKTVPARSGLTASKVLTLTNPPSHRMANQGRSQTPSSASRKSHSVKVTMSDNQFPVANSTAGVMIQTGKMTLAQTTTAAVNTSCSNLANSNPMLLMMQHNGQTLNVLVDPETFQVLNPAQSLAQKLSITASPSLASVSSADVTISPTVVSSTKKSKKGSSQRAIYPKPKSKPSSKNSAVTKSTGTNIMTATTAVTPVSTPLMITTEAPWGDQTTGTGLLSQQPANGGDDMNHTEGQDILAKAAESIFTTEEISPPLVYSPTNDDNPLLIDTSAHDGEEDRSSSSPKKGLMTPKTTPVVVDRTKKSQKQDHQKQLLTLQSEQQKHIQDSGLLLQQQIHPTETVQDSLLQQQAVEQDSNQLFQQQEQEEQKKLQQQQQEQHDHLMRHLESQMALTASTASTTQPLTSVPPSMPSLMSPIDIASATLSGVTSTMTQAAPVLSDPTAEVSLPAAKKSKKSKKKKEKEREDPSEKDADLSSKVSKKASSKKKKKEEEVTDMSSAAQKRREEIDKKQQQLLIQQQEEQLRRKEEEELRQRQGEQLLLLQEHEQQAQVLMVEPQLIKTSSEQMLDDGNLQTASDAFFPDTIEFTPNELSDVLDQVEKLGQINHVVEEEMKAVEKAVEKQDKPAKKNKKNREVSTETEEPASKKARKSSSSKENSSNVNFYLLSQQNNFPMVPQQNIATDDLTASSRMSIYDFQDDSPPTPTSKSETPKPKSKKTNKSKSSASPSVQQSTILSSTMNMTGSVAVATSANTLDSLMPMTPPNKSDSLNTPKPKTKSKKSEKKSNGGASSMNSTISTVSHANVNGIMDSLVTTMTSSKSNDSISTSDSVSVILPMPGFDTLESLNSPVPLISPPIASQKSVTPENKSHTQTQAQSAQTTHGQMSSMVSSDVSKDISVVDSLPDISDIATQANSVETPILQSSQPPPPTLHHPPQNHNDSSSNSVSQMVQQKQSTAPQQSPQKHQQPPPQQPPSQQQALSHKPHQQNSPRQNQQPQMSNHTPPIIGIPQQKNPSQHPQMGPPTSPAQAIVRPRSATSHSHQGSVYPSTSPGGMHTSPSASCISPSSNQSRGSHDGFNPSGSHLTPSPSSARMTDMSSLLGASDMPCPNANLFANATPKLSHVQKASSQGKMCNDDSAGSRSRPGIFSADNFVQPSQQNSSLDPRSQQQQQSSGSGVAGMGGMAGISDSDSFNFTSISLNLTSASTQSSGQDMGIIASSASAPFSFSLTSAAAKQTATSVSNSHNQVPPSFPFYSSQTSSTNQLPPQQVPSLGMLNLPEIRMDNHSHQVSRQQSAGTSAMSSSTQNSFNFGGLMDINSSCSVSRDNANMAAEQSRMARPVDKSPMGGFGQHHSNNGPNGGGGGSGSSGGNQKQASNPSQQQPNQSLDHGPSINRSPQMGSHSSKSSNYYSSPTFPSSVASLNTPPLHHPPLPGSDAGHLMNRSSFDHTFGASQTSNSVSLSGQNFDPRSMSYQKDLNQTRPLEHVSSGPSSNSRKPGSQQQGGGSKQKQNTSHAGSGSNTMGGVAPHSQSRSMAQSQNSAHSSAPSQRSQPPPPAHQTSGSGHPPAPSPSHQARAAKRKQASSQSKKKPTYSDIDANLSHNIFDSNQSFPSLFSLQNMSPPPGRNMQTEAPPYLATNFFGASSRPLSNSSNKNTPDLGPPYSMFPPSRPQNGIGINFQHGFGMQAMTGNHGGGPMTPHSVAVTPHMSNFSLGIFPDVNGGAGDSGLNISPIKFSHHGNPILPPQPGMDPNALQHTHQGSALYHNRSHHSQTHMLPNAMTLNSILGHNHHGFDTRSMGQGINSGVAPPFHGAGHPSSFAMPPLNFSMHEH